MDALDQLIAINTCDDVMQNSLDALRNELEPLYLELTTRFRSYYVGVAIDQRADLYCTAELSGNEGDLIIGLQYELMLEPGDKIPLELDISTIASMKGIEVIWMRKSSPIPPKLGFELLKWLDLSSSVANMIFITNRDHGIVGFICAHMFNRTNFAEFLQRLVSWKHAANYLIGARGYLLRFPQQRLSQFQATAVPGHKVLGYLHRWEDLSGEVKVIWGKQYTGTFWICNSKNWMSALEKELVGEGEESPFNEQREEYNPIIYSENMMIPMGGKFRGGKEREFLEELGKWKDPCEKLIEDIGKVSTAVWKDPTCQDLRRTTAQRMVGLALEFQGEELDSRVVPLFTRNGLVDDALKCENIRPELQKALMSAQDLHPSPGKRTSLDDVTMLADEKNSEEELFELEVLHDRLQFKLTVAQARVDSIAREEKLVGQRIIRLIQEGLRKGTSLKPRIKRTS